MSEKHYRHARVEEHAGEKIIHTFSMFHHEWETDGYGWITESGKIWTTDHGTIVRGEEILRGSIKEARKVYDEMEEALALSSSMTEPQPPKTLFEWRSSDDTEWRPLSLKTLRLQFAEHFGWGAADRKVEEFLLDDVMAWKAGTVEFRKRG